MTAIYKAPELALELIEVENSAESFREKLGGEFKTIPVLTGAMILCRAQESGLPHNIHFMGGRYNGPILFVGRGEGDTPTDLTHQMQLILTMVLNKKERKS